MPLLAIPLCLQLLLSWGALGFCRFAVVCVCVFAGLGGGMSDSNGVGFKEMGVSFSPLMLYLPTRRRAKYQHLAHTATLL